MEYNGADCFFAAGGCRMDLGARIHRLVEGRVKRDFICGSVFCVFCSRTPQITTR